MRVGFDHDGCLSVFSEGVYDALCARGQGHLWKSGPTEKPFWNWYEDWGWTWEQFKELVDWGVDNNYVFTGQWREGAVEALNRVKNLGHEVIIITDRKFGSDPENSKRNTYQAFEDIGFQPDEIYFSSDKTIAQTDMFVEDKIANYDALTAAGTDVYLINRPWNDVGEDTRKRISSVLTYAEIVALKTAWNLGEFDKKRVF